MGKRLFYWELAGALFTAAMGTLLHFVYDWSGGWGAAAAFSAVNESTWEHMKLLFFPMFLFSVVQVCCLGRNYPNFLAARGVSTVTGVALIPVLFYTSPACWGGICSGRTSPCSTSPCWGHSPWISGFCGGGASPLSGSRSWACWRCGGWRSSSSTARSIRRSWGYGRTR